MANNTKVGLFVRNDYSVRAQGRAPKAMGDLRHPSITQ